MKVNLILNNGYLKKNTLQSKSNYTKASFKNLQNSNIPFKSNHENIIDKVSNYEQNSEVSTFIDDFNNYPTREVNEGITKLYDNKYAFLYDEIHGMIRNGEESKARSILNRLNLIGPVGTHANTYYGKYIPFFIKNEKNEDPVEYFKQHAQKSYTDISKLKAPEIVFESEEKTIEKVRQVKNKAQDYQKQLKPFVKKFRDLNNGKNPEFPDYIMFVTDEKAPVYLALEQLKKEIPEADFIYVAGRYLRAGILQERLAQTLDKADDKYLMEGKRSIIFVPHLDDLMNRRKNIRENIEQIRRFMENASEGYHVTLVFYTEPDTIELLDKESLKANNKGLVIK